ncbi:MAG: AraC family transcriptional regulator ligand-binding domain-containing protein [Limnobacter sp.]|nr:AraC family transcriptional regulator ligand-binding domain-containing protein [Limnobacter sp.]
MRTSVDSNSSPLSGHISASYVNLLFDWLEAEHPHLVSEFAYTRPAAGELNRIKVSDWKAMLEAAQALVNTPDLPLRVAARVKQTNTGLLGYIAYCSQNLGEAFARFQQFQNLIYAVNAMEVSMDPHSPNHSFILRWGQELGRPGHLVDSVAIAVLCAFTRHLVDAAVHPLRVAFINPEPINRADFEAFFACPVTFNAAFTEVEFSQDILSMPMRTPDSVMRQLLDQQAEQLLAKVQVGSEPIAGLRRAIQDSVSAGLPLIEQVASRLCMSTRTLQRRLHELGLSFRDELESVRIEMAKNCLSSDELSLPDVASLLGYNDQSAFTNAFKRAVGQTPAKYRKYSL